MPDDLRLVTAYPLARAVAPIVRAHFADHVDEAIRRGQLTAAVPDDDAIEAMIEAAFWASLRREEGYIPKISLAFVAPDATTMPLRFERPLPLDPSVLTRIAPAVERAGIHLGVHRNGDGLAVWGTVRTIPTYCFVLEAAAPGLLVIKHQRGDSGKFVNVAVLEGDQIKIVDEQAASLPDCPPLVDSLLGFESPATWVDSVNVLVQIAVSMRGHGRGGLMLVVPPDGDEWRESIVRPISYAVQPPFTGLAQLAAQDGEADHPAWTQALARAVDAIAGLTAVDGATVLTRNYHLVAFGAKIARRKGSTQVEQVTVTEPIVGGAPSVVHPSQLGGTRHLSAAQFVHDQRNALALVASQDGRFTVFAWSPCENMVHGHRVEVLLI
jgi:sensor domain DACNV-containing protein